MLPNQALPANPDKKHRDAKNAKAAGFRARPLGYRSIGGYSMYKLSIFILFGIMSW
jgi:hypothetical protein